VEGKFRTSRIMNKFTTT
jgi:hypothetical protein